MDVKPGERPTRVLIAKIGLDGHNRVPRWWPTV